MSCLIFFLIKYPSHSGVSTAFPECWFRLEVEIISLKVLIFNFLEEKDMYERLERFLEKPNIRGCEGAMKMDK